jgi:hypothetical protein
MALKSGQLWIHNASFDLAFIFAPQIVIAALLVLFPDAVRSLGELPTWLWVVLVVGVDVSHVYSTAFRTYFDPRELARKPELYRITPVLGWVAGVVLYTLQPLYFWRALAYLAVFHFIRQQYGFMMMYSSKLRVGKPLLDKLAIYAATLYPLLYWHCHDRKFHWFIANDFFQVETPLVSAIGLITYVLILLAYIGAELRSLLRDKTYNIAKNILLGATALTWWIGIISFNNDIAFTATNVIAHGVPYLALIWIYKRKESARTAKRSLLFSLRGVPLYLLLLLIVAFLEEGIWDSVLWREHAEIFKMFWTQTRLPEFVLPLLVPLLMLPQFLHYVYDAFIWRLRDGDPQWKEVLFGETQP